MSQLLELEPILVKDRPSQARVSPDTQTRSSVSPDARPGERRSRGIELDPVLVTPLRRPRKKARKRAMVSDRARPVVIRTAFAMVAVAATFAFAGRIAAFAAEPVLATYRTGQACGALEAEIAREKAVNTALEQDIRYLRTRAGIEQEARRRGWVMPGEVALSPIVPQPEAVPPELKPKLASSDRTISDRIRSAVDVCLAVFGGHPGAESR
jgi:cell division protein FtsB